LVVAQRVFDLVGYAQLGKAQQTGVPQLQDARAHLRFVVGQAALMGQGVALGQQARQFALGVQNALALHLGRVRGEHRRHVGGVQGLRQLCRAHAGLLQAAPSVRQAAALDVPGLLVHRAAADVVPVFGQVGQVAEVGEGADHAHRLVVAQGLQQGLELTVGGLVGVAPEGHRQLADLLDQLEGLRAFLLADHVAEQAAEQADVVDQGLVFFGHRVLRCALD